MLELIHRLFEELNNSKIRYCHWKSNIALDKSLLGQGDLDILVGKTDRDSFETILFSLSFKKIEDADFLKYPSIYHSCGLDEQTGTIVHLHIYYEIITGGSLLKNFHLPLEDMLLTNTRKEGIVTVPTKAAELVLFTIRMIVKHAFLAESILITGEYTHVKKELFWLDGADSRAESRELIQKYLPSLSPELFVKCIAALNSDIHLLRCGILSYTIHASLKQYSLHSPLRVFIITHCIFLKRAARRIFGGTKGRTLPGHGIIIAFVGPEASGKSTLAKEIKQWLGELFSVVSAHAGKPPSTWLTLLPNAIITIGKKILPKYRTSNMDTVLKKEKEDKQVNKIVLFIYAIRTLMIARDRLHLLRKVRRLTEKGKIVICDRYPTAILGAMDSPRLNYSDFPGGLLYKLASLENKIYEKMPLPDLVLSLTVPLDIAIQRNTTRVKKGAESEDYIRRRHAQSTKQAYPGTETHVINTDGLLIEATLKIKKLLWDRLFSLK